MRRRFSLFVLTALLSGALRAEAPRPAVAVLIVVDQLTPSLLERFPADGRLRGLMKTAAVYRRASYHHVPTETAPGHATIATGRSPGVHGIIGNEMYDRSRKTSYASIEDPQKGLGPYRLESPTLGDALRKKYPASRVVSLAGKDRSAILLGGKSANVAAWLSKRNRRFESAPVYGDLPAWIVDANATLGDVAAAVRPPFSRKEPLASPGADRAVAEMAIAAIKGENLGADDAPDLLAVSFSATDLIGHRWGQESPQMDAQIAELDDAIGDLVDGLEAAAPGRVLYALTSDHGVLPMPGTKAGAALEARRAGLKEFRDRLERRLQAARPTGSDRWIVDLNVPDVYLNGELKAAAGDWSAWVREVAGLAAMEPEVAAVYIPGRRSDDPYADVYRRSYVPGRSGDFQIRVQPGLLLTRWPAGTSHGSPYAYDSDVPLFFWGAGVAAGESPAPVSIESVAPTLAAALDALLAPDDARVLMETFAAPAR